ncbi:unnamed protein product, partial [Porites evermanni]
LDLVYCRESFSCKQCYNRALYKMSMRVRIFVGLIVVSVWTVEVVNSEACFFAVNESSGFISSSETNNYKRCTWIITAPSNQTIKLIFTTFRSSAYFWN